MAFFDLFLSAQKRRSRLKTRFRQGKLRIQKFVQQLQKSANEYAQLAKRALQLDDEEQFRQLAAGYANAQESINRWERYLVKLNTLEMRQNEVEATRSFLQSIGALTNSIMKGASPEDVERVQQEMEQAVLQAEQLEESLSVAMDSAATELGRADSLDMETLKQLVASADVAATGNGVCGSTNANRTERSIQEMFKSMERDDAV